MRRDFPLRAFDKILDAGCKSPPLAELFCFGLYGEGLKNEGSPKEGGLSREATEESEALDIRRGPEEFFFLAFGTGAEKSGKNFECGREPSLLSSPEEEMEMAVDKAALLAK